MKFKKTLTSILASLALLLPSVNNQIQACTGARQNAMGNAAVASCDNAHAIYWNQANLSNIKTPQVSYTKQFGKTEEATYDDMLSFACPLTERLGIGIQLMEGSKGKVNKNGWKDNEKWIKAGLGYLLKDGRDNSWSYAIGGALTQKTIKNTNLNQNNQEIEREREDLQYEASMLAKRKNIIQENDELNIGILARQQIGIESENLAVRPAIAYTYPNDLGTLTTTLEFYEADELISLDKMLGQEGAGKKYAKPRVGLEQIIYENIALRTGYDFAAGGGEGVFTAGVGIKYKNLGIDVAITDKNVGWAEISYSF